MKIALISEWIDAWRGGAETSTLQFIHHLMDRGLELHLFTRSRPSPAPNLYVHTIGGASMSRTRRSVTFAHRIERLLRNGSFDVIHAVSPCRGADIYQPRGGTVAESIERNLALVGSRAGRRLKRYANHFNLKQRYMLSLERELLGQPDGPLVIAISDYVVRQLKRHYALPDRRIRKVYNGVDTSRSPTLDVPQQRAAIRREFGILDDDCLVLLVAHNFHLKGVQHWMDALRLLIRRGAGDVRSLVVGKGDSQRWRRLAERLGITGHLRFIGPSDRVPDLYRAADILVHPTYYDPCSRVTLEAMVAGLPCITTRWDGASEVINNEVNGFVLDEPHDAAAIADRVERLRDREVRRKLGGAARSIASRVNMARHAEEMIQVYKEVSSSGAVGQTSTA